MESDRLMEQYKLYVNTAEKVSEKRQNTNTYFLSLNSFLFLFSGYLTTIKFDIWHMLVMMAGVIISIFWLVILKSYGSINSAKYDVIQKMEKKLPVKLFEDEWVLMNKKKYHKLGGVEQGVPIVFMVLYFILITIRFLGILEII